MYIFMVTKLQYITIYNFFSNSWLQNCSTLQFTIFFKFMVTKLQLSAETKMNDEFVSALDTLGLFLWSLQKFLHNLINMFLVWHGIASLQHIKNKYIILSDKFFWNVGHTRKVVTNFPKKYFQFCKIWKFNIYSSNGEKFSITLNMA